MAVSNIFYFHPYLGWKHQLDSNCSNGLKPPTICFFFRCFAHKTTEDFDVTLLFEKNNRVTGFTIFAPMFMFSFSAGILSWKSSCNCWWFRHLPKNTLGLFMKAYLKLVHILHILMNFYMMFRWFLTNFYMISIDVYMISRWFLWISRWFLVKKFRITKINS